MALAEIINAGMNDPTCSFWVGATIGQWMGIKWLFIIAGLYLIFKFIDKLAIEPIIAKIKSWGAKK